MSEFDKMILDGVPLPVVDQGGRDIISDAYDSTQTYAKGSYCLYDNKLYKCTTVITTPEAWTAAHWTESTIGAEFQGVNASLTQKADSILFGNFEVMESLDNDDSGNTMTTTKDYKGGTNLYAIACVLPTTAVARALCFAVFNVTGSTLNMVQFGDRTISGTVDGSGHITFNFGSQYKHATIYRLC